MEYHIYKTVRNTNETIKYINTNFNQNFSNLALFSQHQTHGRGRGENVWLSKKGDFTSSFLFNKKFIGCSSSDGYKPSAIFEPGHISNKIFFSNILTIVSSLSADLTPCPILVTPSCIASSTDFAPHTSPAWTVIPSPDFLHN